jgi:hypothetical protein
VINLSKSNSFFYLAQNARIEEDLNLIYKNEIYRYYPDSNISNPYGSDGFFESDKLRLLMELKYDENFKSKINQCKVLVQALYYVKKFDEDGEDIPNILLIGDKDEVFVLHNNSVVRYLDEKLDWNIAPSKAAIKNPKLVLKMVEDDKITPYIFNIDDRFTFGEVSRKIDDLLKNIKRYIRINEKNISRIYDYFITTIIKDYRTFNFNDLVSIFINLMLYPKENYLHPSKKNILVLKDKREISVNSDAFKAFFQYYEVNYDPIEKQRFTEIADRLIEDTSRRYKGEFYTPTRWVDEAYSIIKRALGEDWREKYVVWDCAWGTGNLTRDYAFRSLYCSTLIPSDLEIGERYNKDATKFQYDFLNDDIEIHQNKDLLKEFVKMPKDLIRAFEQNKPILFFINPPFATANNAGTKEGDHKSGVAQTGVNKLMKENKVGAASQQLYAQFLYRILLFKKKYNLLNICIATFTTPLFLTGSSFARFRKSYLNEFCYEDGMIFQASNFADVKDNWGIAFSVWKSGVTKDKNNFLFKVNEIKESAEIATTEIKKIYNLDNVKSCSDWIKEDVATMKTSDAPQMTNAINIKQQGRGKLVEGALGYYVNVSNNVYKNPTDVYLLSGTASTANGISILEENFDKVISNFSARRLISGTYINWINVKDEYCIPDTSNLLYKEWLEDSLIYSLFNAGSNQSSLREINYKNKKWNIVNNFFFMSCEEMMSLAIKYKNDDVYYDCKNFGKERFVYRKVKNLALSAESKKVIKKACELIESSFSYREALNLEHPKYNLNTWDAGWYQIKLILKEYMKNDLEEFNKLYKDLEDKMTPLVYELGFLR